MRFFALVLLVVAGCATRHSTAVDFAKEDPAVFRAALLEFIASKDFAETGDRSRPDVVLHSRSPEKILPERDLRTQLDSDIREKSVPEDAFQSFVRRNTDPRRTGTDNTVKASYVSFRLDKRIIISDMLKRAASHKQRTLRDFWSEFEQDYPTARVWFALYMPGYSRDGTQAAVRGHFGPSTHGASVTFLLEKRAGKWVVLWHQLLFYL